MTYYECLTYTASYIEDFIRSGVVYNQYVEPLNTPADVDDDNLIYSSVYYSNPNIPIKYYGPNYPIHVIAYLQFNGLVSVNQIEGIVTFDTSYTMKFFDFRLSWNESINSIVYVYLPTSSLWLPDIDVLDSPTSFEKYMDQNAATVSVFGRIFYTNRESVSSYCLLDLKYFPFDTQTCYVSIGSKTLPVGGFEDQPGIIMEDIVCDGNYYNSDSFFNPIGWTVIVDDIKCVVEPRFEFFVGDSLKFSTVKYTIKLKRLSNFYIVTGIFPNMIVTIIAAFSLLISDYGSRLAISFTAMLTVIAILWSVVALMPVSGTITWLEYFSGYCLLLVALICIETSVIYYLSMHHTNENEVYKPFIRFVVFARRCKRCVTHCAFNSISPGIKSDNTDLEMMNTSASSINEGGRGVDGCNSTDSIIKSDGTCRHVNSITSSSMSATHINDKLAQYEDDEIDWKVVVLYIEAIFSVIIISVYIVGFSVFFTAMLP